MPQSTKANFPDARYTTYVFGDKLTGIYAQGVGHTVPIHGSEDMKWFGL